MVARSESSNRNAHGGGDRGLHLVRSRVSEEDRVFLTEYNALAPHIKRLVRQLVHDHSEARREKERVANDIIEGFERCRHCGGEL